MGKFRLFFERQSIFDDLKSMSGKHLGNDIFLISQKMKKNRQNLLIAGGFHGNEPSGPISILKILKDKPEWLNVANVSFLPLVNPTGFLENTRNDKWNNNPNRGFIHNKNKISRYGTTLKDNIDEILELAKDGFLTLHEDDRKPKFFIYDSEKGYKEGPIAKFLIEVGSKFFNVFKNSIIHSNLHDGSFEDFLRHKDIPNTICTEVPGKADIAKKVKCNIQLIEAFVNFAR